MLAYSDQELHSNKIVKCPGMGIIEWLTTSCRRVGNFQSKLVIWVWWSFSLWGRLDLDWWNQDSTLSSQHDLIWRVLLRWRFDIDIQTNRQSLHILTCLGCQVCWSWTVSWLLLTPKTVVVMLICMDWDRKWSLSSSLSPTFCDVSYSFTNDTISIWGDSSINVILDVNFSLVNFFSNGKATNWCWSLILRPLIYFLPFFYSSFLHFKQS